MGSTQSIPEKQKEDEETFEYIQSPKKHCLIKPFPIDLKATEPLPIRYLKKESISLPCSFENKMIKENNDNTKGNERKSPMGGQIQTNKINRHYITSTYFKNYPEYD